MAVYMTKTNLELAIAFFFLGTYEHVPGSVKLTILGSTIFNYNIFTLQGFEMSFKLPLSFLLLNEHDTLHHFRHRLG